METCPMEQVLGAAPRAFLGPGPASADPGPPAAPTPPLPPGDRGSLRLRVWRLDGSRARPSPHISSPRPSTPTRGSSSSGISPGSSGLAHSCASGRSEVQLEDTPAAPLASLLPPSAVRPTRRRRAPLGLGPRRFTYFVGPAHFSPHSSRRGGAHIHRQCGPHGHREVFRLGYGWGRGPPKGLDVVGGKVGTTPLPCSYTSAPAPVLSAVAQSAPHAPRQEGRWASSRCTHTGISAGFRTGASNPPLT